MSSEAPPITRHELESKIVKRCWEDDAFHKEFVDDPVGCFVKYMNVPRAQVPKIVVHEEQPGTWHMVLPAKPAASNELSDEDLEKIAGGTDIISTLVTTILTAVFVTAEVTAVETISYGIEESGW